MCLTVMSTCEASTRPHAIWIAITLLLHAKPSYESTSDLPVHPSEPVAAQLGQSREQRDSQNQTATAVTHTRSPSSLPRSCCSPPRTCRVHCKRGPGTRSCRSSCKTERRAAAAAATSVPLRCCCCCCCCNLCTAALLLLLLLLQPLYRCGCCRPALCTAATASPP
jgi:hypothetical protein